MITEDQRWVGLHVSRCQCELLMSAEVMMATEEQMSHSSLSLPTGASALYETLRAQTQAGEVGGLGVGPNCLRKFKIN